MAPPYLSWRLLGGTLEAAETVAPYSAHPATDPCRTGMTWGYHPGSATLDPARDHWSWDRPSSPEAVSIDPETHIHKGSLSRTGVAYTS